MARSKRTDAIRKEKKDSDRGNRTWYTDQDKLDKCGIKALVVPPGDVFLAILPPDDPEVYFGLRINVHFNVGANNDAFLCPQQMLKKPCPICDEQKRLKAEGADDETVKKLSSFPPRYLFLVCNVENKETEKEGVHLYDAPRTVNDEIMGLSENRRTGEVIDISDPDDGKNLVFRREGKGMTDTRYKSFSLEDRKPIPDAWLDNLPKIKELLYWATEEEILTSLHGFSSGGDSEEANPRRRNPRAEPETEPEEEVPPRRRRREEVAEETEPEEEAPSRRRRTEEVPDEDPPPHRRRGSHDPEPEPSKSDDKKDDSKQARADDVRSRVQRRLRGGD